jgi:hypothetical protein
LAIDVRKSSSGAYITTARALGRSLSIAAARPLTTVEGLTTTAPSPANGRAVSASASSSSRPTSAGAAPRLRQPVTSLKSIGSLIVVARPGWSKQAANNVEQQNPE